MIFFTTAPLFFIVLFKLYEAQADYQVGVGRADCTGPSAEITFMGYAKLVQKGCGIHLRQFARAYIFDDGTTRVAYVTIDACMMNHPIRQAVLDKLKVEYNDIYTLDNLVLSGTHTHSAPGGFLKDVMLDIPDLGFIPETFNALVNGIFQAIKRAHENLQPAKIFISSGKLLDSNINRSPASYEYNPKEERDKYEHNTDKDMVQVKIVNSKDNSLIGAINWFAVHPTSMNNTNCLLSSDNVGYASILLESSINTGEMPGKGKFVGAFASTNLGDVSPNTKGPICINTGEQCEYTHSTCNGENKWCIASGPGNNMFESTEIIATNMFNKATELLSNSSAVEVTGSIQYIHRFVDMPNENATIELENKTTVQVYGCSPAMGYGFAAGTTDGPGEFNFEQGNKNTSNIFWNIVRDFIFPPSPEDVNCHAPKPILIMAGKIRLPYEWLPQVVVTQLLKIGNLVIAAVPGEFTTMSGRRLRSAIKDELIARGEQNIQVVIAGLSNVYTNYIATPEEYQLQRYEGAATIFGPHTLTIYLKIYKELVNALIKGDTARFINGPSPYVFPKDLLSLVTPVYFDSTGGWFNKFGDCIVQPKKTYRLGETASATFVAGHPRNDNLHEKTFLAIEKKEGSDWKIIATDANWETRFYWKRVSTFKASSQAIIKWEIKKGVKPGTYRIRHYGNYKFALGGIFPYSGVSRNFTVTE